MLIFPPNSLVTLTKSSSEDVVSFSVQFAKWFKVLRFCVAVAYLVIIHCVSCVIHYTFALNLVLSNISRIN